MKRFPKRLRTVLVLMLVLFVVGVAGAGLYFVTLDNDGWQRVFTYLVERETGKRLTIAGDFSFTLSGHPTLAAEDVRLDGGEPDNPTPILNLGSFDARLSLRDIFRGVVHIERLRLRDGTFHIRLPSGEVKSEAPTVAEHRLFPLLLGDAEIKDVRVIVHPAGGRRSTRLSLDHFTVKEESAGGPLSLMGKGLLNGYPLLLDGRLGPVDEFLNPTRPYDVELSAELAGAMSTLKGTVSGPVNDKGVNLGFSVHLKELSEFLRIFYHDLPSIGPLEGKGQLVGDFDRLGLQDFSLAVGNDQQGHTHLSGNVTDLTHVKGVHLDVEADLRDGEHWRPVLGPKLPLIQTVSMKGHLSDTDDRLGVDGLNLRVQGEKFTINLSGKVGDLQAKGALPFADLDLAVSAQAEDLSIWSRLAGRSLPPAGPLSLQARLHDLHGALALENLDLSLGRDKPNFARLTGHIGRISPEARPPVSGVELNLVLNAPLLSDLSGFAIKGDRNLGPVVGRARLSDTGGSLGLKSIDITLGKEPEILRLTGRVEDLGGLRKVDLAADIALANLSVLSPLVGRQLPSLGPVKGTLRMDDRDGILQADPIDVLIGNRKTAWIELKGHIADVVHFRNLDLSADVSLQNLTDVASLIGRELPSIGPVRGVATLSGSEKTLEATELQFTLGQIGHDRVKVSGTVGDFVAWRDVDLEAQVSLAHLPILTPLVGRDLPDVGPVEGHFKVEAFEGILAASDIKVAIGTRKTAWLNLTGHIGKLLEFRDVDIKAQAGATDLSLIGRHLPDLGPITASATISDGDASLGIDGLRIEGGRPDHLTFSVLGRVGDIRDLREIEADVALSAKDLVDLSEILDLPLSFVGPVALKTHLAGSKQDLHISGLELSVDQSQVAGDVHYIDAGTRPRLTARLTSPFVAVKDLGLSRHPPLSSDDQRAAVSENDNRGRVRSVESRRWIFGSELLPVDRLRSFDLDCEVQVDHVETFGEKLNKLTVRAQLENSRLEVNLSGQLSGGGRQTTKVVVDAQDEEATVTLSLDVANWDMGMFVKKKGTTGVQEGWLDAKMDFSVRGDSLRQFAASLNGKATLAMRGGQIKEREINLLAQDLLTKVFAEELLGRLFLNHPQRNSTPVSCAFAYFKAVSGEVSSPVLAMETDEITLKGQGSIDFRDERLHLVFDPKPKHVALFSLQAPIMITGTFASPSIETGVWKALLKKAAEAAGLALIDPLAAIIPLADLGLGKHHVCENLLHENGFTLPGAEE